MTDKEKGNRVNALAMTFLEELQMRPHPFADQILRAYKAGYHQSEKDSLPEEPDWLQELHCKLDSLSKEDFEKVWAKYYQKEEPVSKDLEEAAEKYAYELYPSIGVANTEAELAFKAGAQWQKEHFEKNRLKHCNSITNEQAELEQGFIDQHLDKYQRMPTYLDAIEYGMKYAEQQKRMAAW